MLAPITRSALELVAFAARARPLTLALMPEWLISPPHCTHTRKVTQRQGIALLGSRYCNSRIYARFFSVQLVGS